MELSGPIPFRSERPVMTEPRPIPRRASIPILSYHQTDAVPPWGMPYRGLVLPPQRFARQMRALQALGYRGLSMRDLMPYLRGERTGKVVGITLDDGYVNNFDHALPVLCALGFTATSFVVSGQLGGSNVWDAAAGVPRARLMNVHHLREWMDAGMEVGAHTRSHVDLPRCDPILARAEITHSRDDLEQALGVPVRSFCYPYGQYRDHHVEMARAAGFEAATTSDSARARCPGDLLRLPRLTVWLSTPLPYLLARVCLDVEGWRRRRAPRQAAVHPAQPVARSAATGVQVAERAAVGERLS
ncbi:MAG: lipopolysaccharide core oligosaccharide biosynthesis protein polysaccharide deacetylase [Pseudomonadota bacterium]